MYSDNPLIKKFLNKIENMSPPIENKSSIYSEKKTSQILKFLDKREKIDNKIKLLLEENEISKREVEMIPFTEKEIKQENMTIINYLKKENTSPNLKFEYSFSPNLLIKKVNNTESPNQKREVRNFFRTNSDPQNSINNIYNSAGNNLCSIFNKVFNKKSEIEGIKEEKLENEFSLDQNDYVIQGEQIIQENKPESSNTTSKESCLDLQLSNALLNFKSSLNLKDNIIKSVRLTRSKASRLRNLKEQIFVIEKTKRRESDSYSPSRIDENKSMTSSTDTFTALKQLKDILQTVNSKRSLSSSCYSTRQGMKYNMFSKEEKKHCLDLIQKKGQELTDVSMICKVPLKSLKRWMIVGYERKKGCGRRVHDPEMEGKMLAWFQFKKSKGKIPTMKEFTKRALQISKNTTFKASKGWLEKFKRKFNINFKTRIKIKLGIIPEESSSQISIKIKEI